MTIKYLGPLLLAFGLAEGCTMHRPLEFNSESYPKKIVFTPGSGSMFSASCYEGESQIADNAESSENEEALVFLRKRDGRALWIDVGQNERPDAVTMNMQLIMNYAGAGDIIIAYHTHPTPGLPTQKDYAMHALMKKEFGKVGATVYPGYVLMRDKKKDIYLYEFEGFEDEKGKVTGRQRPCNALDNLDSKPAKVVTTPGAGKIFSASQIDGENALFNQLASGEIDCEDAFMYVERAFGGSFWADVGKDETPEGVNNDMGVAMKCLRKGDVVKFYHIHPGSQEQPSALDYNAHGIKKDTLKKWGIETRKSVVICPDALLEYEGGTEETVGGRKLTTGVSMKILRTKAATRPRQ